MEFSTNHNLKVGDIISSEGEQIAIADTHEVWEYTANPDIHGSFKVIGTATIRILGYSEPHICTNSMNVRGLVCFLPDEYKGCGILKVKVTHIHNRSVEAIPIDYIKADKSLIWYLYGWEADKVLKETIAYPNIRRTGST